MAHGTVSAAKNFEESCKADGVTRRMHTVKVPHRDALGNIAGVLVVTEDITDRGAHPSGERRFEPLRVGPPRS